MKTYRRDFIRTPYNTNNNEHLQSWTLIIQTKGRAGRYSGTYTKDPPWERINQEKMRLKWKPSLLEYIENIDAEKKPFVEFILSAIECKTEAILFRRKYL